MKGLVMALRHRYRASVEQRTAHLNPNVRNDLANDIQTSAVSYTEELVLLDVQLQESKQRLEELERNADFVGVRIQSYQRQFQERAQQQQQQQQEQSNQTESNTANAMIQQEQERTRQLVQKQQENQDALDKVILTHQEMEANVRNIKIKILIMEERKREILEKADECRDFLVAAAELNDDDDDDDDFEDVNANVDVEAGMDPIETNHENIEQHDDDDENRVVTEQQVPNV